MTTPVEMDDETKSRLERLQTKIKLETGQDVSQETILERLIEQAHESNAELIDSFRDEFEPFTRAERADFAAGMFHSGTETDEEDIDDILYG